MLVEVVVVEGGPRVEAGLEGPPAEELPEEVLHQAAAVAVQALARGEQRKSEIYLFTQ